MNGIKQTPIPTPQIGMFNLIRFMAASIVVFYHFGGSTGLQNYSTVLLAGPQMVTLFFVLSGFVMVIAYHEQADLNPYKYYLSRFARIFPLYFLAMLSMVYFKHGKVTFLQI